jgi:hypothetical protein
VGSSACARAGKGGGENYKIGLQLLPVTAMVDDIGVVAEVRDVQLFLFERDARAGALSAVRTIAATTTASSGGGRFGRVGVVDGLKGWEDGTGEGWRIARQKRRAHGRPDT